MRREDEVRQGEETWSAATGVKLGERWRSQGERGVKEEREEVEEWGEYVGIF